MPRKWLALARTGDAAGRFVTAGTILVTCSGAVGRSTLAHDTHAETLISHDLLRVEASEPEMWGWLYAFLRSQQARAMMSGAQYGHIIKHLEISHLDALPVPVVREEIATDFQQRTREILALRNRAHSLSLDAQERFAKAIGPVKRTEDEASFEVRASALFSGRRRLEAAYHTPVASSILQRFRTIKARVEPLAQVTDRVWWMTRFRRFYGEEGIPYLSADELFTTNPAESKRILGEQEDGHEKFYVKQGWLVMACSGEVYGLNGAALLATEHHENPFFSHDLIRIAANASVIRAGYLLTALTHPTLGRPLLIRAAYGTSIPILIRATFLPFPSSASPRKTRKRLPILPKNPPRSGREPMSWNAS